MENNENVEIIKHEKRKLHMNYIIAISAIISLGSVVLALYNQDAFVAQVSFAATITSIVLSVIAIWMSISGERSTDDIKVKIAESTERLSGTTKEIETFNNNYKETMDSQLAELKNVQEQLTKVIHSVDNMEKQVSFMNEKVTIDSNTIDKSMMNTDYRIKLFNNIYSWAIYNDPFKELIFCRMVELIIIYKQSNHNTSNAFNDILNYLIQNNININYYINVINTYWGIINTLLPATVFDDSNAVNQILNKINNKLYSQSPNSIN